MDIFLDNEKVFSISDDEAKIMKHSVLSENFIEDLKRRLKWVVGEHIAQRTREIKMEWEQRLIERGAKSLPTDPVEFCKMALCQPDYKDASQKSAEAAARKTAFAQVQ